MIENRPSEDGGGDVHRICPFDACLQIDSELCAMSQIKSIISFLSFYVALFDQPL